MTKKERKPQPEENYENNLKTIKPNGMQMLLNKQKGKRKPEKGKGGKLMTGTIVFGILGFVTMIIGILAQAIPHGENRE